MTNLAFFAGRLVVAMSRLCVCHGKHLHGGKQQHDSNGNHTGA